MHFVSRVFSLPLKTAANTKGLYTEDELYAVLALSYMTLHLVTDPVKAFPLQRAMSTVCEQLGKLIETSVGGTTSWFGGADKNDPLASHGSDLMKSLARGGSYTYSTAWDHVLPTVESMVPIQGMVVCILLTLLLSTRLLHGPLTML